MTSIVTSESRDRRRVSLIFGTRPEAVDLGMARLVGCDRRLIVEGVSGLLTDAEAHRAMTRPMSPYGDGKAAGRIIDACEAFLQAALSSRTRW